MNGSGWLNLMLTLALVVAVATAAVFLVVQAGRHLIDPAPAGTPIDQDYWPPIGGAGCPFFSDSGCQQMTSTGFAWTDRPSR